MASNPSIYPNPVHDKLFIKNISTSNSAINANIFSIDGKLVLSVKDLNAINDGIDVIKLNKGVYLLQLLNGSNTFVKKFMIE